MPDVLLVEDDPDVRGMIAFTLDDYGFRVEEAADGSAAVAALECRPPDAVVLDLMLPEIDGSASWPSCGSVAWPSIPGC